MNQMKATNNSIKRLEVKEQILKRWKGKTKNLEQQLTNFQNKLFQLPGDDEQDGEDKTGVQVLLGVFLLLVTKNFSAQIEGVGNFNDSKRV